MENRAQIPSPSLLRTVFGMMINPAAALKGALSGQWFLSVAVSALAFGLFFTQTGLDLYKTGQKELLFVLLSAGAGLLYGLIVIPLIAVFLWLVLKIAKSNHTILQTLSVFCLSYSGALVYGILGLVFSLALGWKTAIAFGVTGVLWAIGPMMVAIRELTGKKTLLSFILSTLVGIAVLLSWSFFGRL
ncbi:MAG: hypothetical protein EOM08_05430 [Clostridia bacterium]|nr:hypothetical protein [Clostridia bacterium]NCC75858.1 hypothetical protein [Clostridia bacterium]